MDVDARQVGIDGEGWPVLALGVDPGRDKIGWALVDGEGELLLSGICPVSEAELFSAALALGPDAWEDELSPWVTENVRTYSLRQEKLFLVSVGDGTGSRETVKLFERLDVRTAVVDERGTTLEARSLYWGLHVPSWRLRCLPRVFWFPPRPLDDLAAWVIARRGLEIFHIN